MSIIHNYYEYLLSCDNYCGQAGVFDSFDAVAGYARKNGWKIKKVDGKWIHICPECKGE